ncbi:MAG: hypothetical protein Q4B89_00930 [Lachnospiraceae bacterium]|nr:hypothetical protein [Lachnospiraceae bacterium]
MKELDIVDNDIIAIIVNRELEKTVEKERTEDKPYISDLILLKNKLERIRLRGSKEEFDIKEIGFITMLVNVRLTELERKKANGTISEQFVFELRMLRRKLRVIQREDVRENACNV